GWYHPIFRAGRAFAVLQAEDSDGDRDRRVQDGRNLVQSIEDGTATPEEQKLRSLVMAFYVDKPPYFVTDSPLFRPRTAVGDTFTSILWDLRIVAADDDPFSPGTPPGGPSNIVTLRRKFKVHGKNLLGQDEVYEDTRSYVNQQNVTLLIPGFLAGGPCTLEVELCDCNECETRQGTGRCVTIQIPVYYQRTTPTQTTSKNMSRPGSEELH